MTSLELAALAQLVKGWEVDASTRLRDVCLQMLEPLKRAHGFQQAS